MDPRIASGRSGAGAGAGEGQTAGTVCTHRLHLRREQEDLARAGWGRQTCQAQQEQEAVARLVLLRSLQRRE
eukprot:763969-Hanusia_phi.AAC.5